MKLDILDAYNIRARLSASIILLAPIVITLFFLFEETRSLATSSITLFIILAFTNYIPILQRTFFKKRKLETNYAAALLHTDDSTLDADTKKRYYSKLAKMDKTLCCFEKPDDSIEFKSACDSAVYILRNRTRDNHLVQEENINYGLCKNLMASKPAGIACCVLCLTLTVGYFFLKFDTLAEIPKLYYMACISDLIILSFWLCCITKEALTQTGQTYAKTLIMAIDTLP